VGAADGPLKIGENVSDSRRSLRDCSVFGRYDRRSDRRPWKFNRLLGVAAVDSATARFAGVSAGAGDRNAVK
jgi:hypothetical protein